MRLPETDLRAKMTVLLGIFVVAFAAFAAVSFRMMNKVKVQRPVYEEDRAGQELIADVGRRPSTSSSLTCWYSRWRIRAILKRSRS